MLRTFRIGGIHPPENKLSAGKKITALATPKQVIIPLSQHIGAPAQAVVKKGDLVKVGTLLAKAGGFVSANIHSSVSGKVNKIDNALDASGYKRPAIYIDVEGDEWEETIDRSETLVKECALSSKEIVDKIAASGIVGLGGATFPTQVKLMPPPGNKAEIVIINAVECEPYLTSDHSLMLEKGEQILVGVTILMKAVNVNKAVIGIENNKPDAIAHLQKLDIHFTDIRPGFVATDLLNDGKHYPLLMDAAEVGRHISWSLKRKQRVAVIDWRYRILVFFWKMIPRWMWKRLPVKTN